MKSNITTNVGTTTTYFVGNHYEVTDGVVTKYYYAGSQRIAMRDNGTLFFLLGDHLGSTSLVTFGNGNVVSETRYKAWGEERYASGTTPTDYTYTGQYSYASDFGLMFYNARWYDPYLNHFTQPDTIVPDPSNPQAWDKYAYVLNNPIRYNDPTGHKACEDVDANGKCTGDKLARLLDFVYDKVVNQKGNNKPKAREAMVMVVKKAAYIYGKDWNGFLDATTFVFTGYYGHGAGTMWNAHHQGTAGFIDGGSGFHPDFRDTDGSQQVRHFWAGFATAADPNGDNPLGETVATFGNNCHDFAFDAHPGDIHPGRDGETIMDYKLTVTAIDIAKQVGNEIKNPTDLATVLDNRLSPTGPGYTGGYIDPAQWYTPYR